jgi:hypothetical protein
MGGQGPHKHTEGKEGRDEGQGSRAKEGVEEGSDRWEKDKKKSSGATTNQVSSNIA